MRIDVTFKEEDEAGGVPIGPVTIFVEGNAATLDKWLTQKQAQQLAWSIATDEQLNYV